MSYRHPAPALGSRLVATTSVVVVLALGLLLPGARAWHATLHDHGHSHAATESDCHHHHESPAPAPTPPADDDCQTCLAIGTVHKSGLTGSTSVVLTPPHCTSEIAEAEAQTDGGAKHRQPRSSRGPPRRA